MPFKLGMNFSLKLSFVCVHVSERTESSWGSEKVSMTSNRVPLHSQQLIRSEICAPVKILSNGIIENCFLFFLNRLKERIGMYKNIQYG